MSSIGLPLQLVFTALIAFASLAGMTLTPLIIAGGMARAGQNNGRARFIPGALAVVFAAWFAVIAAIAYSGGFRARPGLPPAPQALALALPLIVGAGAIWLVPTLGRALAAPAIQPGLIAVQFYRAIEGVVFLALIPLGLLPALFAIPAGAGDVLVGLTALGTAAALRGGNGRRAAITWNALGLLDLVVAIVLGVATAPGKPQLIATSPASLALTLAPVVLIPAFYVPLSIWLHIVSLRYLLGRAQAGNARGAPHAELSPTPVPARS